MAGLIAGERPKSRQSRPKNRPNMRDLAHFGAERSAGFAIALARCMKPKGSPAVVPRIPTGQGAKWLKTSLTTTGIARHGATRLPSVDVDSFNIELKDDDGFLGDRASKGAFRKILDTLRKPLKKNGDDPLGEQIRRGHQQERARRGAGRRRHRRRRAGAWRDRGIRAGTGLCDAALSQDQGLGRYRTHRGRRRLSRRAGSANSRSRAPTSSSRPRTSRSIWCRSAFTPMKPA